MVLGLQLSGDRERLRGKLRHELRHLQRKFEPSSWRQALSGAVAVAEGRRVYHVKEVELSCVVCPSVRPSVRIVRNFKIEHKSRLGENSMYVLLYI